MDYGYCIYIVIDDDMIKQEKNMSCFPPNEKNCNIILLPQTTQLRVAQTLPRWFHCDSHRFETLRFFICWCVHTKKLYTYVPVLLNLWYAKKRRKKIEVQTLSKHLPLLISSSLSFFVSFFAFFRKKVVCQRIVAWCMLNAEEGEKNTMPGFLYLVGSWNGNELRDEILLKTELRKNLFSWKKRAFPRCLFLLPCRSCYTFAINNSSI